LPFLKAIISIDSLEDPVGKSLYLEAFQKNIHLYEFTQIEKFGQQHFRKHVPPQPDDLFIIMYTSGTTDIPKGVMISHRNFVATMCLPVDYPEEPPGSRIISHLPLAHVYALKAEYSAIMRGISIGYFSGDQNRLFEDIRVLQPMSFPSVPKIFNKLYKNLRAVTIDAAGEEGEIARRLYQKKLEHFKKTGELKYEEWDKFAEKKIGKIFGPNMRRLFSAAAPLSDDVVEFLRIALGVIFDRGYGQTESTGSGARVLVGDLSTSHVGAPAPSLEIKLVDVPSLDYYSTDKPNPRGEICLRGASIMKGYFKDERRTKETIDEEGWLHTGDIGEFDDRGGCLKIIDRIKNIFKLSQGEYIAPEKIAIIIPNKIHFIPWANKIVGDLDYETLAKNKVIINELLKHLKEHGKNNGLKGFEQVKAIYLDTEPFSVENGLLTSTLKAKRNVIAQQYKKVFDQLYTKNLEIKSRL
ncbi:14517_t:CDS:2, partial [Racocetra persica]